MSDLYLTPEDMQALILTFKLAAVSVFFLMLIGVPLAVWLSKTKSKYSVFFDALINLPLVLPPTVLGFYLLMLLGKQGPFGYLHEQFGFPVPAFSFSGLVIGSVVYSLPFVVQPLRNSFGAVHQKYMDAAAVLRASSLDRFFTVTLPLSLPGFISAAVLGFAHTVGEFGVILMIGGNIPGKTRVVSIAIYDYAESLEYARANILSGVLILISFLLLFFMYSINRRFSFF